MARVDALAEASKPKPSSPKAAGLDKQAKAKVAVAAVVLLAAFLLILNYFGAFSSPYDKPGDAPSELTPEQQEEVQRMLERPPPDPDAPITDPNNPPPAGS